MCVCLSTCLHGGDFTFVGSSRSERRGKMEPPKGARSEESKKLIGYEDLLEEGGETKRKEKKK